MAAVIRLEDMKPVIRMGEYEGREIVLRVLKNYQYRWKNIEKAEHLPVNGFYSPFFTAVNEVQNSSQTFRRRVKEMGRIILDAAGMQAYEIPKNSTGYRDLRVIMRTWLSDGNKRAMATGGKETIQTYSELWR